MLVLQFHIREMDVVDARQFKRRFRSIDHDEFPRVFRDVERFRHAEADSFEGDVVDVSDAVSV